MSTFIEQDCTVEHEGRHFTCGGAHLVDCTDGFRRGVVYAKVHARSLERTIGVVTDWHGAKLADCTFGPIYQGIFCRMRSVSFTLDGVRYTGRYCPDWADAVRVRSTKKIQPSPEVRREV